MIRYLNGGFSVGDSILLERLYFCKEKHPPPVDPKNWDAKVCEGWKNLKMDLGKAAIMGGNPITSNGGKVNNDGEFGKIFKCSSCHRSPRSPSQEVTKDNPCHKTSLVNEKQNSQGKDGVQGTKRVKTTNKTITCKFTFSVKVEYYGFYLQLKKKTRCPIHTGHPQH